MKKFLRTVLCIALTMAVGCKKGPPPPAMPAAPATPPTPAAAQPKDTATIAGTVAFVGAPPKLAVIPVGGNPDCAKMHPTGTIPNESVIVNADGTLQNVFVYVKSGLGERKFPTPATPVTLDQKGCQYVPHVLGLQVGQELVILNSDGFLHNINAMPNANTPFNLAEATAGTKVAKKFSKREVMIPFVCNVHPWMKAHVGVVDHPFFGVTGVEGAFRFGPLPAGTYVIEAWHEKYGAQTLTVTIADHETKAISFRYPVPPSASPTAAVPAK